jgi:hypothetical protein
LHGLPHILLAFWSAREGAAAEGEESVTPIGSMRGDTVFDSMSETQGSLAGEPAAPRVSAGAQAQESAWRLAQTESTA